MTPFTRFLIRAAATYILLFIPDLFLFAADYRTTGFKRSTAIVTIIIVASLLAVMKRSPLKTFLIFAICIQQAIWCGSIVYFGDILTPDKLLLSTLEHQDVLLELKSAAELLWPIMAVELFTLIGLLRLHSKDVENNISPRQLAAGFAIILICGLPIRWVRNFPAIRWVQSEWYVFAPSLSNATATAFPQAVAATLDAAASKAKWPDINVPQLTYGPPRAATEPTIVVLVMGESINPMQLSLFDPEKTTTPRLQDLSKAPPTGFELISRIGFAAGVATLASVPQFIRPSHDPLQIPSKNLFDIAQENKFDSWYLSTQSGTFLSVAGGAKSARRVVTSELTSPAKKALSDAYLVELQREALADRSRHSFIFLHQRTNHAPYTGYCAEQAAPSGSDDSERIQDYQSGLRCWDSNVRQLLDQLRDYPGAVYAFVTSDHNEFMDEDGLWGHTHLMLENAMVPMLLFTNRPQSAIARGFKSRQMMSAFAFTQDVSSAIGTELIAEGFPDDIMLLNGTLQLGVGTSIFAKRMSPWNFETKTFVGGQETSRTVVDIPDARQADTRGPQG